MGIFLQTRLGLYVTPEEFQSPFLFLIYSNNSMETTLLQYTLKYVVLKFLRLIQYASVI